MKVGTRRGLQLLLLALSVTASPSHLPAQTRPPLVRVAYSALSAGIGTLWIIHEQGIFKKHGLDLNLIYMRSGTTAAQALFAGEIQFAHISPAPMMAAWIQGADVALIGTTPPYPSFKGLEPLRESLVEATPQLKQADLRKFVDDRFVKAK